MPTDQIEAACALLRAAMESEQHVFVDWAAHVEKVYVRAFPASTEYSKGHSREALIDETVRLGGEAEYFGTDPLPRLRELAERVRGLG
jgi:tRNA/tmRNA/rRNA uracil-C5-methylase (TrmA/RlmC/RlmD family)